MKPDSQPLVVPASAGVVLQPNKFNAKNVFVLGLLLLLHVSCAEVVSAQITSPFFEQDQQEFFEAAEGEGFEFELESESEEETERIETERHDFTQSTTVVGRGVRQVEFGYSFFQNSNEEEIEDSHATPELMIRFGLTEKLEFRIRYNQVWQFGEEDFSGSEDVQLNFKRRMSEQLNWRPESALEIGISTPTGGVDWSTDEVEFGMDYIYGWRLNSRTEFYGSSGFATNALGEFAFRPDVPADEEFMLYTQSFAIGTELTRHCTAYSEVFGLFTDGFEDDEERPVFFNVGLDFYLSDNMVLDIRAGTGINEDAEDLFFGMGGAFRF